MNNVYRLSVEPCDRCLDFEKRIHENEQHDLDAEDLKKYAWSFMSKMVSIGIALAVVGGGSALFGLWIYEALPSGYREIVAATVWLFGLYIATNSVLIAIRYHSEKSQLINRLEDLRGMRREKIRKLNNELREFKKKEKEAQ